MNTSHTVDISAKVKGISSIERPRVALTMNEVQMLVDTPCKDDVLKRAFLFSILTGLRHSDIQALRWKQIQQTSKGTWQALVVQQKTKRPDYKPVTAQALQLCGERPDDEERLVFEGLTDVSWISIPLKAWIEASGIKKHVTFHCARHAFIMHVQRILPRHNGRRGSVETQRCPPFAVRPQSEMLADNGQQVGP